MKTIRSLWKHYLYHTKLVHKFLFLLVVLFLVEIIVSNFYIKNNASDLLTREIHTTSKQFIEQYTDNIDYRLTKFKALLDNLSNAEQIKQVFSNPSATQEDYLLADAQIREILDNQFPYGLYDLTFYTLNNPSVHRSTFIKPLDEGQEEWKAHLEDSHFDYFFMHTEGSYSVDLLSILKPVYSSDGMGEEHSTEIILKISSSNLGSDEIGIFDTSFTHMVHQVNQLIEKNYITEIRKKDAEFMALQAQINPHFLFNSLEIINSLIEVERYHTACEVNQRLSDLLRYSINHNSSGIVTLAEEIDYMNNYVYIQHIRFENNC